MADTLLAVIDARPNRETMFASKFAPIVPWRLFGRDAWDKHGSSPVSSKGFALPHYPADLIPAMKGMEALKAIEANGAGASAVTVINNQVFLMPPHGVLDLPAQSILAELHVGCGSLTGGNAYLTTVKFDLVRVAADGTVTQLATTTDSTQVAAGGGSTFGAVRKSLTLAISAQSFAATERMGWRLSTTGYNTFGAGNPVYHCLNAASGTPGTSPAPSDTYPSTIYFRYQ